MPGYLLDTNHITAWELQNPRLMEHFREAPPENIIWVCPISLGELECGFRITNDAQPERRRACREFIEQKVLDFVWEIGITTRDSYAQIMDQIWRQHPSAGRGVETQQHLSALGVDVNDVWIAAVAMERNLILLTNDRMQTIRECVPEIRVENWLE
ncbi:MAG: PIN domain-containing protein [Acidobacteriota bacterium]|nr:PIN domain-containing protein [Acidobacteriota bacterium]